MTTVRKILITIGFILGLVAVNGGTAYAASPTTPAPASSILAQYNNDNWCDHHWCGNNNRDRDRDRGDWRWNQGHRWWGVSPWQCRWGGGRVDWRHDRCWGGRFGGARLRW